MTSILGLSDREQGEHRIPELNPRVLMWVIILAASATLATIPPFMYFWWGITFAFMLPYTIVFGEQYGWLGIYAGAFTWWLLLAIIIRISIWRFSRSETKRRRRL